MSYFLSFLSWSVLIPSVQRGKEADEMCCCVAVSVRLRVPTGTRGGSHANVWVEQERNFHPARILEWLAYISLCFLVFGVIFFIVCFFFFAFCFLFCLLLCWCSFLFVFLLFSGCFFIFYLFFGVLLFIYFIYFITVFFFFFTCCRCLSRMAAEFPHARILEW